jgi:hypothetical protein
MTIGANVTTITGFSVVDDSGLPVLVDPFGNNVAFRRLGCGGPVLAIALANQRGSSVSNPSQCRASGSKFFIEVDESQARIAIHRLR